MNTQAEVPFAIRTSTFNYIDQEITGLEPDGTLTFWNDVDKVFYTSGETPEDYGLEFITPVEMERINLARSTS